MPKGNEFWSRDFASRYGHTSLVADKDKYLFAREAPKYRFNVIGAGTMGQEHIRVTNFEGRATINGVYDPEPLSVENAKAAQAQYSDSPLKVYATLEEACADPDVDGLIICTPNYTHIDAVRIAAKSGKHILVEKPVATTIPDAYEIAQIADAHEGVIQVGLQYRYKAIYTEAIHEALERKTLGNIKTVSMVEHRMAFLDKVGQWNKFSRYSGGTLVEKCCHYFDLINLFAQSTPKRVFASGSMAVNFKEFQNEQGKSDILDNAMVVIEYENGVRGSFGLAMFVPMFYEEIVLCGDIGRLRASENLDFLPGATLKSQLEIFGGETFPSRMTIPSYPVAIEESGHNGATFFEHAHFVDSIDNGKSEGPTAMDAFWSVVVGVAAETSVATGEPVEIQDLLQQSGLDQL
ncbi:MAG: Gfo/Idh/MocA family oxidoreductase [Gammaproteobacteria bacterium]|nr:Gfo/Idh/MocA family oxidoreductase [Gammaproteobacteria bacterium]NNL45568.1 Gfo/Idh/MocA family oxidoreductase [Woeseiaceae bacterium]